MVDLKELAEKVDFVKVEILGIEGRRVIAKIGNQRKPRKLLALRTDEGEILAQGDSTILKILDEETGLAIYNTRGEFFFHLHPSAGARFGRFPREFVDALRSTLIEEGEIIGHLPEYLGGSPVYFGGCKSI